jgi:glyoxylase-like metal-dependent hydrolase (beta-lactamase superfamily II)
MGKPEWTVDVLLTGNWRGATSVLLTDGRLRILVDTGMAHEAHQLVKALEARGLQPSDIQVVINTHFHVDHVLNNCLFSNSRIYASQESYDWCRSVYSDLRDDQNWEKLVLKYYPETFEHAKAKEYMGNLRKLALRWWDLKRLGEVSQFRWVETQALPEGLEGLLTSGHVPGHVSVIVHGREPAVIAGDALLTREHDEQVLTMIPHNRAQFQRDRARLLARRGRIVPGHDQEFSISLGQGEEPGGASTPGRR